MVGTVEGHREHGGTEPCFIIRLSEFQESFELCSTSYSKFDLEAYKRDVRTGSLLVLRVVDEIKRNRSTGETKYWVQDVRLSDTRVYLDLNAVQEYRKGERVVGIAIAAVLAAVAARALWKAFVR